ncbi:hypothetical protein ACFUIW_13855 [Streptomyces sp. NPDC057245]|uniref:hypothetical protein n=1 Tax=Streptomyces TaxID=1883 RepID=UPI001C1E348F|nr:hypothetical protein [Streptomyces sp. A108]MBU6536365.1 hypothetical protein [Streptomyces sp. A108]
MASAHARRNKAGEVTSHQVKWGPGGRRTAPWQTETFDRMTTGRPPRKPSAAVNENHQQWPPGWVKGQAYIDPTVDGDGPPYLFDAYARECIKNKTGVEQRYRQDCYREPEIYLSPTFAHCDVRSTEHFSKATVAAWVNKMGRSLSGGGGESAGVAAGAALGPLEEKFVVGGGTPVVGGLFHEGADAPVDLLLRVAAGAVRPGRGGRTDTTGGGYDTRYLPGVFSSAFEVTGVRLPRNGLIMAAPAPPVTEPDHSVRTCPGDPRAVREVPEDHAQVRSGRPQLPVRLLRRLRRRSRGEVTRTKRPASAP